MSIDQASPLVPIKPQISLQNSAFIKNSHNRSSFCGATPSPTNGNRTFKTFSVNRKSWSGNVTLPLQQFALDEPAPHLGTFRSGTGTFPRNRERNNNSASNGILTPNGNSVQTLKGNEVRRSGCSNGRRYAEIGNWSKRNATFLEPHIQGVRRRDSRSSDSDRDERSTEDDERCLIRTSPRTRLPPPPPPPPDDEHPPMKPREFFERLQSQAMREAQDRKQKRELKESNHLFRSLDADGSLGDSLSQSRESLSSDGEGAKGDCSSVGSSGSESEEQPPCDIGVLERLIRTHPVWFLPGIQRAGAFHLLQGKEEGNFVVRQSSQPDTMAISVRLPADKGPYIEHYLIQASNGRIGLETSHNRFDNIPELIAHYSQCCDELPVQLQLPKPLREAKSRHQLSSLALLGQEFWGYPMANPKNNPNNLLSPCQLANGVIPMAVTPSDTGSSLSSFNANKNKKMPRCYKRKTDRIFSPEALREAIKDVRINNLSIRKSAAKHGISKSRLFDYFKKTKHQNIIETVDLTTNFRKSQVFPPSMEASLAEYLIKCSSMFHGLTPKATRRLAYEYAERNGIKYPQKWKESKCAGPDWFSSFLKRNPNLSIRTPEATSLARMTSFNRATVAEFQNKLQDVITRYNFTPSQIYNLDETGITTVQRVPKVVAQKGQHQVGQVTSRERGELVTQVGIISAAGHALPPVWVFPRHRFDKKKMMQGIPETSGFGLAYPSGWMTSQNFLKVLEYFVQNVHCSIENKVLLIMDNHDSHLSIDGLDFCKTNGIVILTLPPHTSNKLQPLDRTVFGPFKTFYNSGLDSWMLAHPGQTVSIYDIPQICLQAWDRAANPTNIKSGFRCTGIWPFDKNIFTEQDFLSSYVSDRPESHQSYMPETSENNDECVSPSLIGQLIALDRPNDDDNNVQTPAIPTGVRTPSRTPSISSTHSADLNIDLPSTSSHVPGTSKTLNKVGEVGIGKKIATSSCQKSTDSYVSLQQISPFPKAAPRKSNINNRGRRKGRCMIATDTPEKEAIEAAKKASTLKKSSKKMIKKKVLQEKVIKTVPQETSSDESIDQQISSSESEYNIDDDELEDCSADTLRNVPEGRFIIVKVYGCGKQSGRNYAAKVVKKAAGGYNVEFYKRKMPSNRFVQTNEEEAFVTYEDIVLVLPVPSEDKRPRFQGMMYFNCNLDEFQLQ